MDILTDISRILSSSSFRNEAGKILQDEFVSLLKSAAKDKNEFIKNSAHIIAQALLYKAQGHLNEKDVMTILRKQKKIAQIEANNAEVAVMSRIQKITYRLLDISIDFLVKAL